MQPRPAEQCYNRLESSSLPLDGPPAPPAAVLNAPRHPQCHVPRATCAGGPLRRPAAPGAWARSLPPPQLLSALSARAYRYTQPRPAGQCPTLLGYSSIGALPVLKVTACWPRAEAASVRSVPCPWACHGLPYVRPPAADSMPMPFAICPESPSVHARVGAVRRSAVRISPSVHGTRVRHAVRQPPCPITAPPTTSMRSSLMTHELWPPYTTGCRIPDESTVNGQRSPWSTLMLYSCLAPMAAMRNGHRSRTKGSIESHQ